jgi:DNA-binding response OmpR family regulator
MIDRTVVSVQDDEVSPEIPVTEDVLVIEATLSLAEILEYALANAGMRIRVLSDGEKAQSYLEGRATTPSVVLVDLDLRGVDGFAYLRRLIASAPASHVVVISGHGAERDQIRALGAGAIDYFPKPLSVGLLVAKIERLLKTSSTS